MSVRSPVVANSSSSSSPLNTWTPQSRNPISLRLYKILGTNYNDEATREALQTLSELYAGPASATTSKGAQAIRNQEYPHEEEDEDSDPKSTLVRDGAWTESVPGEVVTRVRKNLRRDMEDMLAEGSRQFLKAFGEVDQKLDELQTHIDAMRVKCDEAEAQLALTNDASKSLLERAGSLRDERQDVENKISIVTLFLERFTLNDEEVEALTSRDVPIGRRFFQVMDKTERIRDDCRVLMAGEDGPTKAGLDIMTSTSAHLEQGYERIFRWCSYEFRQMGRDVQLEVGDTMREAVRRLRKRPELLNESLTSLSQTRQPTLLSTFIAALTRGGPSGLPRPIELHAHDPLRYAGDMLAWVHQAIAAEREFLEGLFGVVADGRMVGSVRTFGNKDGEEEEEEWIGELMNAAVGKLCGPLKARIQQTIRSQESSIVSYKIANLIQFYTMTMRRTIGDEALLSTTLQEMTDMAYKVFYDAIEAQGRALLRIPLALDDSSLTPPSAILEHLQILREILSVYHSSLLGDESPGPSSHIPEEEHGEDKEAQGFARILDIMIGPAIEMCIGAAGTEKKRLRSQWDREVWIINCLTYIQSVLEPYEFTRWKHKAIQEIVDEHVKQLTDEHYENIMADAGLNRVVAACESRQPPGPLSRLPGAQPAELQAALARFSLWLSGLEVVHSPRLTHLTAQRLHTQIHHAALARMAHAYQGMCDEVQKAENRYEAAATMLGSERPFGQIGLLWQIFGLEEAVEEEVHA